MKHGNCYERAFHALIDGWHDDLLVDENPLGTMRLVLVHGFPKLTEDSGDYPKGTKFGHAWLEQIVRLPSGDDCNILVVDCGSHGERTDRSILPNFIYYRAGNIIEAECRRYEIDEAKREAVKHEHYGHWISETETPEGVTYAKET